MTAYSRSLVGQFVGVDQVAGQVASLFALDLPLDHLAKAPERYSAVTTPDLTRLAKQLLPLNQMRLLIIGDKAVAQQAAAAAGLPLKWLDAQGKPLPVPAKAEPPAPGKKKGGKR